jgi:hypothetical protein
MLFQLRLAGAEIVRPVMDLAFAAPEARPPKVPTYLVTGSHARDGKVFASQLVEVESALVEIDQVVYEPGRVVTADERGDRSEIGVFSVYRVR